MIFKLTYWSVGPSKWYSQKQPQKKSTHFRRWCKWVCKWWYWTCNFHIYILNWWFSLWIFGNDLKCITSLRNMDKIKIIIVEVIHFTFKTKSNHFFSIIFNIKLWRPHLGVPHLVLNTTIQVIVKKINQFKQHFATTFRCLTKKKKTMVFKIP